MDASSLSLMELEYAGLESIRVRSKFAAAMARRWIPVTLLAQLRLSGIPVRCTFADETRAPKASRNITESYLPRV